MNLKNIDERHISKLEEICTSIDTRHILILLQIFGMLRAHVRNLVVGSKEVVCTVQRTGPLRSILLSSHLDLTTEGDTKQAHNGDYTRRAGIERSIL